MRLLILGGTVFLGRHLVDQALLRGHDVTLFNRGQSAPTLYPDVRQIHGDRDGGLDAIPPGRFDAVIDTSGYVPRVVSQSAERFSREADQYVFVSTISVYRDNSAMGMREDAPLATLPDPGSEDVQQHYGALKALSEAVVRRHGGDRPLIIRPGLIVGPWDPSDRFTYWPWRAAQGGRALAPGRPERAIQFIDARDLAAWILALVERGVGGTLNATSPSGLLTMGSLLAACQAAAPHPADFTWVDEAWLVGAGVGEWMELPLWIRETPDQRGFFAVDVSAAEQEGLSIRPVADTVRDTLAWHLDREPHAWTRTGLPPARETELLRRWDGRAR